MRILKASRAQVDVVQGWVLGLFSSAVRNGVIGMPPPIYTRIFQEVRLLGGIFEKKRPVQPGAERRGMG